VFDRSTLECAYDTDPLRPVTSPVEGAVQVANSVNSFPLLVSTSLGEWPTMSPARKSPSVRPALLPLT
jgi:hypothetical protein